MRTFALRTKQKNEKKFKGWLAAVLLLYVVLLLLGEIISILGRTNFIHLQNSPREDETVKYSCRDRQSRYTQYVYGIWDRDRCAKNTPPLLWCGLSEKCSIN